MLSLMKPYVFWLLAIASSQALPVESGTKITPRRLASKVEPKQQANTLTIRRHPRTATTVHQPNPYTITITNDRRPNITTNPPPYHLLLTLLLSSSLLRSPSLLPGILVPLRWSICPVRAATA